MDYEDRIVVFLDVLGFSNFTNYTGSTQINQSKKIEKVNNVFDGENNIEDKSILKCFINILTQKMPLQNQEW